MTIIGGEIQDWLRTKLFEEVPISISVVSPDFRVVEANRLFEETFGPWKNRQCYEVYKDRSTRCEQCAALETFADGKIRTREEEGISGDGGQKQHYLVHMFPVTRAGGEIPYVIEMSTDITAVKRLEAEKREAERLAAVGETLAGLAHGVKNVLMGLEGGMYAVDSGIERADDERIARGWGMLQENVARISQFVKEFLDFAKGREAKATMTDPNNPVRKVMRLFAEEANQAGILLTAETQGDVPPAPLDEDGIYTCLANLVSNAIDACLLSSKECSYAVLIASREEAGSLVYEVRDNGHGMDYEISKNIFSKFFSTKGSDRGTGLGLLTTKKIVHQHGGKISFTSTEGVGSTFRIELPRSGLPNLESLEEDQPQLLHQNT